MPRELCDMTIAEVSPLIGSRQLSPVELTEVVLQKIADLNPRLNAFLTVVSDLAREQARAAEKEILAGQYRGSLHGIPVALKDLFFTRGVRTTAGSKIFVDFVPEFDATVVDKLRQAGAVLVGKTALHELAYGVTNDNPHFGPTRNPWNTEHSPGGSSGGSGAALAAGMVFAALGTDTGGSIRIPSSFCGVTGLKPTFGRVSLHGVFPLAYTLDHAGPMARSVEDVAAVYQAIAGYDPQDDFSVDKASPSAVLAASFDARALRIGVPSDYFFDRIQPDIENCVQDGVRVFERLGSTIVPVKLPGMVELTEAGRIAQLPEAYLVHKRDLENHPGDLGRDVKLLLERGKDVGTADYINAQLARQRFRRQLTRLFHDVDVLLTPTTPLTAFPIGATKVSLGDQEEDARTAATRFTRCFNATGNPALSVCCGFDRQSMPVGLQIVGRWWDEVTVLQAGFAYQQATDWHKRKPAL